MELMSLPVQRPHQARGKHDTVTVTVTDTDTVSLHADCHSDRDTVSVNSECGGASSGQGKKIIVH